MIVSRKLHKEIPSLKVSNNSSNLEQGQKLQKTKQLNSRFNYG